MAAAEAIDTRLALIRSAEVSFAANGIDGVSLREIVRSSGAKNTGAIQYHFGDRTGLLRAVLARHADSVAERRHALLDAVESAGDAALIRDVAGALVRPLAAKLGDADGGRNYLRIQGHLFGRPDFRYEPSGRRDPDAVQRWRRTAARFLSSDAIEIHRRFSAITITVQELARRAEGRPRRDDRLFVANLVDLVAGVLQVELSVETAGLLDDKRRAARRR